MTMTGFDTVNDASEVTVFKIGEEEDCNVDSSVFDVIASLSFDFKAVYAD